MPDTAGDDDAFFDAVAETQLAVQRAHEAWLAELTRRRTLEEMGLDTQHLAGGPTGTDGDADLPDWRAHRAYARRGISPPGSLSIDVALLDGPGGFALLVRFGDAQHPDRPVLS